MWWILNVNANFKIKIAGCAVLVEYSVHLRFINKTICDNNIEL